jgi:Zn-dependent metalloprotease
MIEYLKNFRRKSIDSLSGEHVRCFIVPPHILEQIALRGHDQKQRESALDTLALSEGARQRRQIIGTIQSIFPAGTNKLQRTVFDCKNEMSTSNENPLRKEGEPPTNDDTVKEAYDYSGDTYNFYDRAYGRNSVDDNGMALNSYVHYGSGYNNAFWDGSEMVYGDGDDTIFGRFTKSIDVIGHELTHGVTQFNAGLDYSGQSGALNESFSDVFGSMVKQFKLNQTADEADWLIGAELLASNVKGRALRDMFNPGTAYDDPVLGKDPQPGHMRDYVRTKRDHGGVHIN